MLDNIVGTICLACVDNMLQLSYWPPIITNNQIHVTKNTTSDGNRLPCLHIGAIENNNSKNANIYDEIVNPIFRE